MQRNSRSVCGQSSVEYALVLLAFLSVVVALCAIWHAASDGTLLKGVRHASSHNLDEGFSIGLMQDLSAY